MSELEAIKNVLKRVLADDRYAKDYTGRWRFLAATPDEHRELLKLCGLETPALKFGAGSKTRAKRKTP